MRRLARHHPSPAMIVALVALVVALGGSAYAALQLPANSVGTKQIKNQAVTNAKLGDKSVGTWKLRDSSVTSHQIKNGTITPPDLAFSLPLVPPAAAIYSGYNNGPVTVSQDKSIGALQLPAAGGYAVLAKAWATNNDANHPAELTCRMTAGWDSDTVQVHLAPKYSPGGSFQPFSLTLVHPNPDATPVTTDLRCHTAFGVSVAINDIKITAITAVGMLQNKALS